jgi:hypothetical protein
MKTELSKATLINPFSAGRSFVVAPFTRRLGNVRICPNQERDWTAVLAYRSSSTDQHMEEAMTKQTKAGAGKAAASKTQMTQDRASAIQSRTMKDKGTVSKDDFSARATRAAARNGKDSGGK